MKNNRLKILFFLLAAVCIIAIFTFKGRSLPGPSVKSISSPPSGPSSTVSASSSAPLPVKDKTVSSASATSSPTTKILLTLPLKNALERVTKKPFGLKVSPGHSPVTPERFSGYHAGADFEIFPGEENSDVAVSAVCDGSVLYKRWVSGYGGVIVQSCRIDNEDVTVLYGHLKNTSVNLSIGDKLTAGEPVALLGKGYSTETDGERKHLHLSIHKGKNIVLLGYVQKQSDLNSWLNPLDYLH